MKTFHWTLQNMIMIWHKRENTPTQAQLLKSWHSCIPRRSTKTATLIAQL